MQSVALTVFLIRSDSAVKKVFLLGVVLFVCYRLFSLIGVSATVQKQPDKNQFVVGVIASIPVCHQHGCRFMFSLKRAPGRYYYLSWYGRHATLHVGQTWFLRCRLRDPIRIPSYFKRWLWSHSAVAEGAVDQRAPSFQLRQPLIYPVLRLRERLQSRVANSVSEPAYAGVISALTVGSRALLDQAQWQVFQRTGTSHLVAISGLHVGLVAVACYWLCLWLVRRCVLLLRYWPAQQWAGVAALIGSCSYAVLAGLSVPTQRALIMLFAYHVPALFYLRVPVWRRLVLAFVVITLIEPVAFVEPGFWLSFAAVASIAYVLRARVGTSSSAVEWMRLHAATSVGLVPLTLFFFEKVSIVMLAANAVAVPWVTLLIVPLSLLGCVVSFFSPVVSAMLFQLAAWLLAPLWCFLQYLASFPFSVWPHPGHQLVPLLISVVGVSLLLSPLPRVLRLMGCCYLLALFY